MLNYVRDLSTKCERLKGSLIRRRERVTSRVKEERKSTG